MSTRRGIIQVIAAVLLTGSGTALAQNMLAQAADFIRQSGNELAQLAAGAQSSKERRAQLDAFIDRVADVDAVARFCLGRYWRLATPSQQQAYVQAFHQVLVNSVAVRLHDYQGGVAKVTIERPAETTAGINVSTTVERSNNPPVHVTWVVSMASGNPKIIDVVAEGMSMRLTQRSDYASFMSHNNDNVDALIKALRRQAGSA